MTEWRPAFSLIELVAALALAAMLTIAVLAAMHSMAAAVPTVAALPQSAEADAQLVNLLRFDLCQASSIRQADGTLYLAGDSGLDQQSLQPTHRPVLVAYSQEQLAGRNWLVRQQTALDVLSTTGTWSDLVAADSEVPVILAVPTVPILPPDITGDSHAIIDKTPYVFQRLRMQPIPPAMSVMISREGASPLLFHVFLP